ncbi:fatty-acid amide hydrolase 2-A-like [Bactrocera tryoni]|uniref:fatty-acid amide hydrolase 2-A-like n=1 Tax=Bactrocera tryoni TaxID=59916 RepID=UPI001A966B87|nr:fatty-acid amide hydrolase 2-A-like [Bactrocera tryoni]
MEFLLRLIQLILKLISIVIYPLLKLLLPRKGPSTIPPIRNQLVTLPVVEVIQLMKLRKLKSEVLVRAYIERIKEVNPHVDAVVQDRFEGALEDAVRTDELIAKTSDEQLSALFSRYTLLGIPFTVKESCGLKGMSICVGSRQRAHMISSANGGVVNNVVAAGGIPLLVSITPEYCFSIETISATQKRCLNPHDSRRTPGGSSGGEGALNGAGASLFGIGSDIGGSIRYPSLFNGVFGHKPTGGIISVEGHFPDTKNKNSLSLGPITRFGRDLGVLMQVIAGENAAKLDLLTPVETKDIKIFYALGFDGLNGILHTSPETEIKLTILTALRYLKSRGCEVERASMSDFRNSLEISFGSMTLSDDFPYLINTSNPNKKKEILTEMGKAILGKSEYTRDALYFESIRRFNAAIRTENILKYKAEAEVLKAKFAKMLGNNGVFFFPTFPVPALYHNSSILFLSNVDYCMIFNILGFPTTHIPMGHDDNGLPVGFQVVAAPYKDKLCFQIAAELEAGFGGWVVPTPHKLDPLK